MSLKRACLAVLMIAALGLAPSAPTATAAREVIAVPQDPSAPGQTTITLGAAADATLRSDQPTTNFGA
ncbi:MAG: hypothetical protein PVI07_17095, partial [Anaerolineae bacterium]